MTEAVQRLKTALEDRYTIERELGAGGMATVYLAHDVKHDRKVALKVLKPELAAVVGAERFLAEIRTTANLQHPHILPLFDSDEADGVLYFVMPYVEGESLRDRLDREKQATVDEAVHIAREVADALGHAHAAGVIHRDIKPANILLRDGRVQVADFGIALAVQQAGGTRLTETGLSVGTPHYMSPEQASGDRELDGRSDVYALGCVLYEMLAGEPPHVGPTAQSILSKILTEEPRPLEELRTTIPSHVSASVRTAIQKLPADRFRVALAFTTALADEAYRSTAGAPDVAREGSSARTWKRVAAAAVAVAVLLTAVLAATVARGAGGRGEVAEVTRLPLSIPDRRINEWGQTVVLSADGSKMAYPGADGDWWVRSFRDFTSVRIAAAEEHLAFSPDGESVAFRTGGWVGGLHVQSLAGDRLETLWNDVGAWGIHWGHDGWIYFTTTAAVLARVHNGGGAIDTLSQLDTPSDEVGHAWPQLLPDGRHVLFTVLKGSFHDTEGIELEVLDLETGTRYPLGRGVLGRYANSGHLVFATANNQLAARRISLDPPTPDGPATVLVEDLGVYGGWRGAEFALSDEGTLLYVDASSGLQDELTWVSRSGDLEPITADWGGRLAAPALSLDGSRLAVQLYRDRQPPVVYTFDFATGNLQPFSHGNVLDSSPHWANDGASILFAGPRPPEHLNWDIYRKPTGGGAARLVKDADVDLGGPVLSQDGSWLVYTQDRAGPNDIWAIRFGGDETPLPVAVTDASETNPVISPDGELVAYQSDRTGDWEIWITQLGQTDGATLQVSVDGGSRPKWGSDSDELFFVDPDDRLMTAEISAEAGLAVVRRRPLFSLAELGLNPVYDVTRDGQRFVFVKRRTQLAPGSPMLIQNFFEELKAKVGN